MNYSPQSATAAYLRRLSPQGATNFAGCQGSKLHKDRLKPLRELVISNVYYCFVLYPRQKDSREGFSDACRAECVAPPSHTCMVSISPSSPFLYTAGNFKPQTGSFEETVTGLSSAVERLRANRVFGLLVRSECHSSY